MRNIAKCKACSSIIESKFDGDHCECSCGCIAVSGGSKMECAALIWDNFLRVDDEGNVVVPQVRSKTSNEKRAEILSALDEMIRRIEEMPPQAMVASINHYDFVSLLILISTLFKSGFDENSDKSCSSF